MTEPVALDSAFMSRSGRVARSLARSLLSKGPGDRLPPISDLAAEHHVGVGTIQRALDILAETGAVTLEPRGALGTFVTASEPGGLWQLSGQSFVLGTMPLPYLREYEGLATALRATWRCDGVGLHLSFVRGAANRLEMVAKTTNEFAVTSRFAAETAIASGGHLVIAREFGAGSYGRDHVVLFAAGHGPQIGDGYRVGIDRSSYDQVALTHRECAGRSVTYVEVGYMHVLDALASGRIQAAIWDSGEIHGRLPQIEQAPLTAPAALELTSSVTTAVLVVGSEQLGLDRLVSVAVDPARVRRLQRDVVSGRRMPAY
jgi:hypothetical protein